MHSYGFPHILFLFKKKNCLIYQSSLTHVSLGPIFAISHTALNEENIGLAYALVR